VPWLYLLLAFQLDPSTKTQLLNAIAGLDQFCVTFQQLTYSDFFDDTRASGQLCVSRPGRLKMAYTKGEKRTILCDGEIYLERDHLAETESRMTLEEIADQPLIRVFLFGRRIDQYFTIERFREEGQDVFRFRPRDSTELTFLLVFDDDWKPTRLEVQSPDGEGTQFRFGRFDPEPEFPEGFFDIESDGETRP